jgi:hypothetical protein
MLSNKISEYEHIKGQTFADSHSYIRLKKRLADRIRVITANMEQARTRVTFMICCGSMMRSFSGMFFVSLLQSQRGSSSLETQHLLARSRR